MGTDVCKCIGPTGRRDLCESRRVQERYDCAGAIEDPEFVGGIDGEGGCRLAAMTKKSEKVRR